MGVDGQRHTPAALPPVKWPGTHCTGCWLDSRASLDGTDNLSPTGIRSPNHPACSELLHRLSYTGPQKYMVQSTNYELSHKAAFCIPSLHSGLNIFDSAVFLPLAWETKFHTPESTEMYPQLAATMSSLTLHCAEARRSCLHHGHCAKTYLTSTS